MTAPFGKFMIVGTEHWEYSQYSLFKCQKFKDRNIISAKAFFSRRFSRPRQTEKIEFNHSGKSEKNIWVLYTESLIALENYLNFYGTIEISSACVLTELQKLAWRPEIRESKGKSIIEHLSVNAQNDI